MRWTYRQTLKDIWFLLSSRDFDQWTNIIKPNSWERKRRIGTSPRWRSLWRTLPRKREKSQDISKMKDDVKKPKKAPWLKRVQKDHHGKCPGYQTAQNCQESSLSMWNSFINIFSLNCFYEAKNISSLFISRKLISSLKKLNSNKFEFDSWFYRVSPIGVNTLGRKRWYFHTYEHNSIILNQLQFFGILLAIFSRYPKMKQELDVRFDVSWRHPSLGLKSPFLPSDLSALRFAHFPVFPTVPP